jgi:LacI family transcriptional regulator
MGRPRAAAGRPTTIIDIARAAGVSKSTVSLVLKGSPLVKPETRQRVERVIERYGYVYNRAAANLRKATSSFVGMVISDLTNPFFAELAVGIEDALYQLGFTTILANTNEDPARQAHVLRTMRESGVAGLILSPARGTTAWDIATQWPPSTPLVVTMRRLVDSPLPYVGPDNRAGMRLATEHLIGLGHERIAFLGGQTGSVALEDRVAGYRDALLAAGGHFDPHLIFEAPPNRSGGRLAVEAALALPQPPTAVVCYNDIVAIGVTRALATRGIQPGRDMSVVGFDDIAEAEYNAPPLTTVAAGSRGLGGHAAQSLLGLINGADPAAMTFIGATTLVVRDSSGAMPRKRRAS